jgi:hypothetical protein
MPGLETMLVYTLFLSEEATRHTAESLQEAKKRLFSRIRT